MKMNTQEVTLLVILNLSAVLIRLIITSFLHVWMRSSGYVDWPWNGSGRTWRKEVSESPSTDLSQSALVWSVVSHKGHVWAPCFSSSMHPSYSGWLRINFHIAMQMAHRFIWVSSPLATYPRKMQSVRWNAVSRRSGAGWSMKDSFLMTTRLSLSLLELASNLKNCRLWILK